MTAERQGAAGPQVRVTTIGEAVPLGQRRWKLRWELVNDADQALEITSAWLPHARFRSDQVDYVPPLVVVAGGKLALELAGSVDDEEGPVVENGFILLRTRWREEPWRIFVRVRVTLDDNGRPTPSTQAIQTQLIASED
jgi:hypothetical protein